MAEKKATAARKPRAASEGKAAPAREQARPRRARKAEGDEPSAAAQGGSPSVAVVDASNKKVREIALSADVFAAKRNTHLVYEAVKQYRAGGRRGTHMTKNRALVSGSGKKPWRQKGTGRARAGETRNPLWRHGGTVFGPQPRDYSYTMPKKARAAALRAALTERLGEGGVKVVESFGIERPKTKALKGLLAQWGIAGKAVVVDHEPSDALVLSGRNLPGVKVVADSRLTAYDVMDCRHLVVTPEALDQIQERLALRGRE